MGEASIEQLDIDITSSVVDIDKNIDKIIDALGKLSSAMKDIDAGKFESISSGMKSLSDAVQGFANVKATDFSGIAKGVESIGGVNPGSLKNVADNITQISEPLQKLATTDLGSVKTEGITQVSEKTKEAASNIEALLAKYSEAGKEKDFTGGYDKLQAEIARTESKLTHIKDSMAEFQAIGRNTDSKSFETMAYRLQAASNYLDTLNAKMAEMDAASNKAIEDAVARATARQSQNTNPTNDTSEPESLLSYGAKNVAQDMADAVQPTEQVAQALSNASGCLVDIDKFMEEWEVKTNSVGSAMNALKGSFTPSELGNGENYTQEYVDLEKEIQKAEAQLQRYADKETKMSSLGTNKGASWKSLQYDIENTRGRLEGYYSEMSNLQSSGGDVVPAETTSRLQAFGSALSAAKGKLGSLKSGFSSFAQKVGGALSSVKSFASNLKKLDNPLVKAGASLKRFATTFKNTVTRMVIRKMIAMAKEGFENLAQYSDAANKTLSEFSSSLMYLKNSFATAFSPILSIVQPYITAFIDMLSEALAKIGMFFAAISGSKTFTKAVKTQENYAASLDKSTASAKKLASATTGIDELNIISDNSNSGSGASGTDPSQMFEEVEVPDSISNLADKIKDILKTDDWSEIGKMIAQKLNEAMAAIPWDKIQAEAYRIAHGIGTLINGFVDEFDWNLLGYTIGQGVNTALIFANTLLTTIDFKKIGTSIGTAMNSAINTIDWTLLGQTLANGINMVIEFVYGWVTTFDFKNFGNKIGTGLTAAISAIKWSDFGTSIGTAVTGLFQFLDGVFVNTDWKALGKNIMTAVGSFFTSINWGDISSALSHGISALCKFLTGVVKGIKWDEVPQYIITAIGDFFKNFDWKDVAKSLGELLGAAVKGAIDLVGSIWDLLKEAWGDLTEYFDKYINDAGGNIIKGLWNGITDALKNCGKWIKENIFDPFIDGFKDAFGIHSPSTEMKTMGGYIVDGLINGITGKFSDCMATVTKWASNVKDWFFGTGTTLKDKFSEFGGKVVDGFKSKVSTYYTNTKDSITTFAGKVKSWFTDDGEVNSTKFGTFASNVIDGFKSKIGSYYTTAQTNMETFASNVKTWFSGSGKVNNATFTTFAQNAVDGFKSKIGSYYTTTQSNIETWASKVLTWFQDKGAKAGDENSGFKNLAKNCVDGFKDGINSFYTRCKDSIESWAKSVLEWFQKKIDSHSPSKKFKQFGLWSVQGYNDGIEENADSTNDIIDDWVSSIEDVNPTMSFNLLSNVDETAKKLQELQTNYGSDFGTNTVLQTINRKVEAKSSVDNSLDVSDGFKDAMTEAIRKELAPLVTQVVEYTKTISEKKSETNVFVGNKKVANAVEEQKAANGYSFSPA